MTADTHTEDLKISLNIIRGIRTLTRFSFGDASGVLLHPEKDTFLRLDDVLTVLEKAVEGATS